jgi:hypothetical protein
MGVSGKVLCGQVEVRLCQPDGKLMQVNYMWVNQPTLMNNGFPGQVENLLIDKHSLKHLDPQ